MALAGAGATRASDGTAPNESCGPIAADGPVAVAAAAEVGVAPSERSATGPGEIVTLPEPSAGPARIMVPGEALLALPKAADGSIPTGFELAPGASVASSFWSPVLCATVVRVVGPGDSKPAELVSKLPETALAVPNHVYRTAATEVRELPPAETGDDPYRPLQWGLERAGSVSARGVSDGAGARVAILDSAPDVNHRDLAHVVLVRLPDSPAPSAALHGSLMAGVVGAVTMNDFGIAAVAPGAELLAVPVCERTGAGSADECRLYQLLRGVDVAFERGARVVNLSLVGPANPLLRKAMDRLEELGVVTVAAVGNEGVDEPRYPAAYPSVIGVGAVDREGRTYARGNRGEMVELLAPGVEIVSTVPGNSFAFGDGTSLAAAHVSGVLALGIAAGADPLAVRAALFEVANARAESPGAQPAELPSACALLGRLGKPCR
jgi:subtilisin family serine protease